MTNQEKVNALGKHFENFNERINTDPLFGKCIQMLVEGHKDVYEVIDILLNEINTLLEIVEKK